MSIESIKELVPPTYSKAHLYFWFTNSFAEEAHQIVRAWGLQPKTILTWAKIRKNEMNPSMKTGYYFRSATEHILFCTKGNMRLKTKTAYPTWYPVVRPPDGSHSSKPDFFYELVEACSPGPFLEMFARKNRRGWTAFGNQVENSITL